MYLNCLQENYRFSFREDFNSFFKTSFRIIKFIYSEKTTKFCEIFILLLSYVVPVKSKEKILQNFVAFSEYINFTLSWCDVLTNKYCWKCFNKQILLKSFFSSSQENAQKSLESIAKHQIDNDTDIYLIVYFVSLMKLSLRLKVS